MRSEIESFKIKESQTVFDWKANKRSYSSPNKYGNYAVRIKRTKHKDGTYYSANLYFSKQFRRVFNSGHFVELFFSKVEKQEYLGIRFLKISSDDSYKVSCGTKRHDGIVTKALAPYNEHVYKETELEMDVKNNMIVLKIEKAKEEKCKS